jgi:hypothetical protein
VDPRASYPSSLFLSFEAGSSEPDAIRNIPAQIEAFLEEQRLNNRKPETITQEKYKLLLIARNCDINNPYEAKEFLANYQNWNSNTKRLAVNHLTGYYKFIGKTWKEPIYKKDEKLPFIPTEQEIDINPKLFMNAMRSTDWVDGWRDRRKALKSPKVIISTAGMLKGGPAAFYVSKLGKKASNAIFLVSYQIPGTPGKELLEKGVCTIDGKVRKVKARYEHFDFSSHCGASQLKESLRKLGGKPKVFVVHGEEENCKNLAKWAESELGLEAVAPKTGDTFEV